MFETRVTKMLGIKYPILAGTMMYLSTPEFVAACSEAGALGILASAMFRTQEDFRDALKKMKDLTDKPLAVNLNLFPAMRPVDNNLYLDVILDEGIKIVETSGHKAPEDLAVRFKEGGLTWMHKCVGVRYALKVQGLGADIVTVVGYENGGATGVLDIGTLVLVPRVVESLKIPVVGGGGVGDGRGIVALLSLGAEGVIMGTRLLNTDECPLHPNVKKALVEASELDTLLIMRSIGNTHRVWKNEPARKIQDLEQKGAGLDEIVKAAGGDKAQRLFSEGKTDVGTLACGQAVGLVHDTMPVKDLLDKIMKEAEGVAKKIGSMSS